MSRWLCFLVINLIGNTCILYSHVLKVGFQCLAVFCPHSKWTFILVFGKRKLGDQTSSVNTQYLGPCSRTYTHPNTFLIIFAILEIVWRIVWRFPWFSRCGLLSAGCIFAWTWSYWTIFRKGRHCAHWEWSWGLWYT